MFCDFLLISLSAFTITCYGDGVKETFPVAIPKPGYEISPGIYTLSEESFILHPQAHYFGKKLGRNTVGDRIICIDNERKSCIHYGTQLKTKASHGCIRTSKVGIDFIFEHSLPGTEVIINE